MEYKLYCTNQKIAFVFLEDVRKNKLFADFIEVRTALTFLQLIILPSFPFLLTLRKRRNRQSAEG